MRAIQPISQLARRLPEAGRLRFGVKVPVIRDGKPAMKDGQPVERPKALATWRVTSQDRAALDAIAETYGGTVREWKEPKAAPGQFEVITEANELRIVLPPDPLGGSPVYERWGGGGRERSCDGVTCSVIAQGPEGAEPCETNCVCAAKGAMECEPKLRLSVILPQVRFTGVWRMETSSWNAVQEIPGFVDLLLSLQDRGLTRGLLRLEHRRTVVDGRTKQFIVPALGVDDTIEAIASGASRVGAVDAGSSAPALPASSSDGVESMPEATASLDDDIIEAEVVVDERTLAELVPEDVTDSQALLAARSVAKEQGIDPPTSLEQITDPEFQSLVLDRLIV